MSQPEIAQIGKYQIVGQVGEGAMGVVYRATDPVLNRTVAIKVMSDAIARNDDLRGRFLREAQAAGSLQHPNVVTIYDFGEVNGHPYIAMEFVEGEDLESLLQKKVALSLTDKLEIIIDVLSGLAYAHKHGIVHRDIKPANIRIDEEGRARIMDFGIAHLSSSDMTRTGVMVGTPAYMAPEQIVGTGIVPATDLFSVGAVLYELLSGEKPFDGDSLQNVMYRIVSKPTPPLPTAELGLPAELGVVLDRALAKDAGDRYPSAVEMANALNKVRAGLDRNSLAPASVPLRSVIDTALAQRRATSEHAAQEQNASRRGFALAGFGVGLAGVALAIAMLLNRPIPTSPSSASATSSSAPAAPPVSAREATPPTDRPSEQTPATRSASGPLPANAQIRRASTNEQAARGSQAETSKSTSEAVAVVRGLQASSMDGRRRAVLAGASGDQLRLGDETNRTADSLIARGKLSEAAAKLNDAAAAWSVAERDAKVATSVGDSRGRTSASEPPKSEPIPVATAPAAAPVSQQAAAAKLPPASAATEIEAAVAAYAHAIESRDVTEIRRAYPGITAVQAKGFEQFFASIRGLKAAFTVSSLDVSGNSAEGKLAGTYDYVTTAGKSEQQAVAFLAAFRREAGVWKLASVR
jgi:serine/threonine protein kinase